MPKNSDYWRERMKMLENALLDDSYETVKNIEEQFDRANKSLEADIARWYQRFADNNEISLAEARRLLTSDELAEFKWTVQDYIKHGQSLDKAWAKQLENASARVHISRLESLKIQLQQHAEELAGQTLSGAENTISGTYRESYYHTAFEFQKGISLGWSLQSIDKAEIDKVLSNPWSTDMKTFRDRCWTNKEALVNSVNKELTQMIMRGEAPDRAISAIQKQFNVAKNKAGRLIMTESAAFAATARQDCFDSLGVEQYIIVGTLDNETCSLCGSLDGKHFKMSEYQVGTTAPPFHPWCRCTTAPYYDDWNEFNVDTYRTARDDEGEYYEVPRDMTYQQWKAKSVKLPETSALSEGTRVYTRKELTTITQEVNKVIDAYTDIPSKWSGRVVTPPEGHSYCKLPSCDIGSIEESAPYIMLHESLHARSISRFPDLDYKTVWKIEEGTIELFAHQISRAQGIPIIESQYTEFIEALVGINNKVHIADNDLDFAKALFSQDVSSRLEWLETKINDIMSNGGTIGDWQDAMDLLSILEV